MKPFRRPDPQPVEISVAEQELSAVRNVLLAALVVHGECRIPQSVIDRPGDFEIRTRVENRMLILSAERRSHR